MAFLAKFVYFIYQKTFGSTQEIEQKKMWHKIAYFFLGCSRHPDWYARAALADECMKEKY
jgi:hypothetical protein